MIVPYNALLYLALIRSVFCTGAISKPSWKKVCKKNCFYVSCDMLSDTTRSFQLCFCYFQKQPLAAFSKKDVFKHFENFTGKHLCLNLFLIKLQVATTFLLNHPFCSHLPIFFLSGSWLLKSKIF